MVIIKNKEQIDGIRKSCKALAWVMSQLIPLVKPGMTTLEIDRINQELIAKTGGKPAFLGYRSMPVGYRFLRPFVRPLMMKWCMVRQHQLLRWWKVILLDWIMV